jgi:hypothetical protein
VVEAGGGPDEVVQDVDNERVIDEVPEAGVPAQQLPVPAEALVGDARSRFGQSLGGDGLQQGAHRGRTEDVLEHQPPSAVERVAVQRREPHRRSTLATGSRRDPSNPCALAPSVVNLREIRGGG